MPLASEYAAPHDPMNPMDGLPASAYGLASLGRGGDTTLMHVSPREVDALQKLAKQHGGSLTINPKTGLPEAGFLDSILPTIIGIGASFIPGVNAVINPLTMGLLAGAGAGIASGFNPREMLKWGLGVGGGAGLGAGLSGMMAAPSAAGVAGTAGAAGAAGAGTGANAAALNAALDANAAGEVTSLAGLPETLGTTGMAGSAAGAAAPTGLAAFNPMYGTPTTGLGSIGGGLGSKLFGTGIRGALTSGAMALYPALTAPPEALKAVDPWSGKGVQSAYEGPWQLKREVSFPDEDRYLTDTSEYNYFTPAEYVSATGKRMAQGGIASINPDGNFLQYLRDRGLAPSPTAISPTTPTPSPTTPNAGADQSMWSRKVTFPETDRYLKDTSEFMFFPANEAPPAALAAAAQPSSFPMSPAQSLIARRFGIYPPDENRFGLAKGGTARIPHKGGYLDGPGDGMSDSIPATIEDRQPARLADGEFVIPADVVSHIGNGSSKAGAKRLYAMMDKIRHARTGNKKQGKQINPNKYLPA